MKVKQLALKTLSPLVRPITNRWRHRWQWTRNGNILYLRPLQDIAPAQSKLEVQRCLDSKAQLLGNAGPEWQVLIYQSSERDALLKQLGRLREMTFRQVGEGTGKAFDLDDYDLHYEHLLLWHPAKQEIVAAYRMRACAQLTPEQQRLYSQELFDYGPEAANLWPEGCELGRSFICPDYWHSRSLDYLWQGIGLWLQQRPQVRYLFGPVTLPGQWRQRDKALLIGFYQQHFAWPAGFALAKKPFKMKASPVQWTGDYGQDLQKLKEQLARQGLSIPTLYKQYTELCSKGGVGFAAYNLDASFGHCVDGLVVLDLTTMKPHKAKRYLGAANLVACDPVALTP